MCIAQEMRAELDATRCLHACAELLLSPAKALVEDCSAVACGAEFTMWLSKEGRLLSAGGPQHGQLGHGTDHEYNAKDCALPPLCLLLQIRQPCLSAAA